MNFDFVEALHLTQQLGVILRNKPVDRVDVMVAPPFVDIRTVSSIIEADRIHMGLAAQHVSSFDAGAYTGEVSALMLKRLNVGAVIVGHSERRGHFGQTDEVVRDTVVQAAKNGLNVILCCGESLEVREGEEHRAFVKAQLEAALSGLSEKYAEAITVAYEPIWAIGTGLTASSDQVAEMMTSIRECLTELGLGDSRVLYGGSVNEENASELISEGKADGFLVGGASLKAESFMAIVGAAQDCYASKR
jgi:triosephosphate isomerase